MSGKAPRQKGDRFERQIVNTFIEGGISSERVPLSGSAGGSYTSDLTAAILGDDKKFEAKCRGAGFGSLYKWIAGNYGLVVKRDRDDPLVVVRLKDFISLARRADQARSEEEIQAQDPKVAA